ncbi:Ltp family lipoprotein [Pseudonocardia sp. ICBG1293]|uniref:Ltp family lipoprotein n=1 Tax=Pseudonocardia sp. ICBG1293 TaxID=2844382 RepID=UPI001CCA8B44|nr:Ltp family lipoprotein [Pseudonocardia sp. ICBG1293]
MPAPKTTLSAPDTFAAAPPEPTTPALSVSRQNAVASAESYLDYTAFSRQGLIDQLTFEDYSTADATYAVDHVSVDWNEQAAKSAKSYMDYSSFSRGSLIDQLEYEGFTAAQAKHGADSVGL